MGASSHGTDVAHVHHDAAVPGEPWVVVDEVLEQALGRQQVIAASAIGDGGAVVTELGESRGRLTRWRKSGFESRSCRTPPSKRRACGRRPRAVSPRPFQACSEAGG